MSEKTYRQLALEDPEGHWELACGDLRQKPTMSVEHSHVTIRLLVQLATQLDEERFAVRSNNGRVRRSPESYFIPDVFVVPMDLVRPYRRRPDVLDAYDAPLPLIVEVWSPSTGDYDVDSKLPEYQRRGDIEIWRVHPYERTLTAWRRQPDGSYAATAYDGGVVQPIALPNVTVDLDALFT